MLSFRVSCAPLSMLGSTSRTGCDIYFLFHKGWSPTGKRPLGKPRCRWEDNIRMDLEEISIIAENWVDSAQDRNYWRALVNAALNLRVP